MKASHDFNEYRIYYATDSLFQCLASSIDDAIYQLAKFYGDSFRFTELVSDIKVSTICNGWVSVELPKYKAVE